MVVVVGKSSGSIDEETVNGAVLHKIAGSCVNATNIGKTKTTDDRHNVNLILARVLSDISLNSDGRKAVTSGDTKESGSEEPKSYPDMGAHVKLKGTGMATIAGESVKESVKGVDGKVPDITEDVKFETSKITKSGDAASAKVLYLT